MELLRGWVTGRNIVFVALAALLTLLFGTAVRAFAETEFPRPAVLEPNINFWVDVFSGYTYRDFVVHDRTDVQKIYEVMHLPGYGSPSREEVEWANNYLKTKYADILTRLGSGQTPVTYEELRVAGLFQNQPGDYVTAASNIRVQQGLRERFRESLVRGHYYLPRMTKTFEANGLPTELAVLPLVESGFTCSARSSAGAVGIWQFTRSTGKQFLTISRRHDDRLNATRSTQAAAELLRYNYQVLGDWALAITAYNYGTYGMARAAATYGQDFGRILQSYDGRSFGFASKNYYAEFLAALQIYRAEDEYFPGISDEITAPAPAPQIIEASYEPSRSSRRSHNHRMASRHHGPVHRVALKGRRGRHPVQRTIYHAKKTKAVRKA